MIDRPFSVVRELLDNSLDSGCSQIEVHTVQGGIDSVRIIDDGCGMTPDDLELCWLPHATSKIETEEDLYRLHTLGFRGEALSSIAAVSRLEIISSTDTTPAHRITIHGGTRVSSEPWHGKKGTIINVSDLFYSLPGRKKFLKRGSSEALLCRNIFLEKALPFPHVAFKYFSDNEMKLYLPADDLTGRISAAYSDQVNPSFLRETEIQTDGFSVKIILSLPDMFRKDRKYVQIFVNRRRIFEFSLVQAVEYGFTDFMPGGRHPIAFVYIDIDPELVDFNIHPAKREVKFLKLPMIHHTVVESVRTLLKEEYKKSIGTAVFLGPPDKNPLLDFSSQIGDAVNVRETHFPGISPDRNARISSSNQREDFSYSEIRRRLETLPSSVEGHSSGENDYDFKYMGCIMGVFLVVERNNRLFLVDQHAAHERMLFNRFTGTKQAVQTLLIPYSFETTPDEDVLILNSMEKIEGTGITLEKAANSLWSITAVPETCRDLLADISSWLRGEGRLLQDSDRDFWATMACRKAVKDGDIIDDLTAMEIIKGAFTLEIPRCPHGRPVWASFSKDDLFRLVERL